MANQNSSFAKERSIPGGSNPILKAWLIAGTLDISCALLYYYIKTGNDPLNVLTYVAKTALGQELLNNKPILCVMGLLIHFVIAFGWTIIFFWLYPKLKLLQGNKVITGLVYGLFIWLVMTLVVVPLRTSPLGTLNMPHLKIENSIIGAVILMLAVGLPVSLIIGNYYSKKTSTVQ